ncbi:integrin beta-2-like [Ciona intestinalis]
MLNMERIKLFIFLAVFVVYSVQVSGQSAADIDKLCEDTAITSCDQCIRKHPQCAWCSRTSDNSNIKRCRSYTKTLQASACATADITMPRSDVIFQKNLPFSSRDDISVVQLRPQNININLRKGDTVKFNVTFRKVKDYPVDLYYVMDLSNSMKDDLAELQKLGASLAEAIRQNVTSDINMGFGTFVDKVMMPFTSTVPDQLKNPCVKADEFCSAPFGFRHQQPISGDLTAFKESVQNTNISGNIDSPEGGFDALMQIAVCGNKIGWRESASHLVVFTTDASFHTALDGKLAAILDANDMQCHLTKVNSSVDSNVYVYDKSKELDYPSIGQLRAAFVANKIQPIFAVTKEVRSLYDGLKSLIPNSFVDELANDSNNIISIIKTAYNKLKEKLQMSLDDDNKPTGVGISYRTLCPTASGWADNSLSCDQIKIGSEVTYEFTITASTCPATLPSQPMTFTSSSLQEFVKFNFNFLCDCNCSSMAEVDSPSCSTNGSLVCGACLCNDGHEGSRCQCTQSTIGLSLNAQCKRSDTADICERNGRCVCGVCDCDENYHGTYCQCTNTGCPVTDGNVCGVGGKCENCYNQPKCNCTSKNGIPYTLDNVGSCTCHESECIDQRSNNTMVCSGNGNCSCSSCNCDPKYDGIYCQHCNSPSCKTITAECSSHESCAICVNAAVQNRENANDLCQVQCKDVTFQTVKAIPDCSVCSADSGVTCPSDCADVDPSVLTPTPCTQAQSTGQCKVSYNIVWKKSLRNYLVLIKEFDQAIDCPKPINPLVIVLPIVAGIVILGLIALIAWKVYQTYRDKREWKVFENEMKQSKWTKGQNPIFEEASTRFENPTFHAT